MLFEIILLFTGFFFLIKGAGWLVDGSSSLAKKYKVSDLAVGLTIVAFGTSTPELVVNAFASYQNHHDIVFGNVIGSNNFNIFIILGIAGIIVPLTVHSKTVWNEIPFSLLAVVILFFLGNDIFTNDTHLLSRFDGFILFFMFGLFLFYVYKNSSAEILQTEIKHIPLSNKKITAYIVFGLAALVAGGQLVVSNAILIATNLGVSEQIIGLTIVAAGTSLPELATSVTAAIKKNNDIAIGNIIGSNIFNIFSILAISSFINPLVFEEKFNIDLYLLAGGTLFLFSAMFMGRKRKLDRWEAGLLLTFYVGYLIYIIQKEL